MCVLNQIFGEGSTSKYQLLKKSLIRSCVFCVTFTHRLPLTVLENSMDDALYRESLNVVMFGSTNSRSFRGSCSGNTISMQIRSMPAPFE